MVLGGRIRAARLRLVASDGRIVSQEALAHLAGVHRTYIGQLERGEVNVALDNLLRVADALALDPSALVQGLRPSDIPT